MTEVNLFYSAGAVDVSMENVRRVAALLPKIERYTNLLDRLGKEQALTPDLTELTREDIMRFLDAQVVMASAIRALEAAVDRFGASMNAD